MSNARGHRKRKRLPVKKKRRGYVKTHRQKRKKCEKTGKVKFDSWREAERYRAIQEHKRGIPYRVYPDCPFCGGFHLTTQTNKNRRTS